jgi:hypothetical protein
MSLVSKSIPILCNSNELRGALNKTKDGRKFEVQLNGVGLNIPKEAVQCSLSVDQVSVWNVSYNVSEEIKNNKLRYYQGDVWLEFLIPDGQYSVNGLNLALARHLELESGFGADYFTLIGRESDSRIIIKFTQANTKIDFSAPNSIAPLLGFDPVEITPNSSLIAIGNFTARFNRINNYVIRSSLAPDGIPVNNNSANVIANVPIDVSPGNLITYSPRHPTEVNCDHLIGHQLSRFYIELVDQDLRPVDTVNENYYVLITIKYQYIHIVPKN